MLPLVLLVLGNTSSFVRLATAAAANNQCFVDRAELKAAVDSYVTNNCGNNNQEEENTDESSCNVVKQTYGYPMNSWCVGNVTDMYWLFLGLNTFNEDISSWDVSNVVNMYGMFRYASSFNGDLSSWDTSSLQGMNSMFNGATAFESDLSGKYTKFVCIICFAHFLLATANLLKFTLIPLSMGYIKSYEHVLGISRCNILQW